MAGVRHGVEQEFQIVDSGTGRLVRDRRDELLDRLAGRAQSHAFAGFGPDGFPSQLECWVGIVEDLARLEEALRGFRAAAFDSCTPLGLGLLAAGVNPIDATITDGENFGEHHHVGVSSAAEAIRLTNLIRWFVPEFIALTANSRVYAGRATGYASYRLHRTAHCKLPPCLGEDDERALLWLSHHWDGGGRERRFWDVTPFVKHGRTTVEVRLLDVGPSIARTLGVATLLQALRTRLERDPDLSTAVMGTCPEAERELAANRAQAIQEGWRAELEWEARSVLPSKGNRSALDCLKDLVLWLRKDIERIDDSRGSMRRNLEEQLTVLSRQVIPTSLDPTAIALEAVRRTREGRG